MEIEVGEWVKFKDGNIDKIKDIIDTHGERKIIAFEKRNSYLSDLGLEKNIVKHSKNILDLIQVGDYVNGERVLDIRKIVEDIEAFKTIYSENEIAICVFKDKEDEFWETLKNSEIESIVTKESFASVEYKVEEEQ